MLSQKKFVPMGTQYADSLMQKRRKSSASHTGSLMQKRHEFSALHSDTLMQKRHKYSTLAICLKDHLHKTSDTISTTFALFNKEKVQILYFSKTEYRTWKVLYSDANCICIYIMMSCNWHETYIIYIKSEYHLIRSILSSKSKEVYF